MKKMILVLMLVLFPATGWADEYVLVMSKEDNVCQHMLKIYNEDLKKYREVRYDEHEEFKAIKWKEQKSYFQYPSGVRENGTLVSKFDINNDGKLEVIIKDAHRAVRGIDADGLYIFREKDFDDFKDKLIINENFADKAIGAWGYVFNKKPFKGNFYRLYELPAFEVWTTPTTPKKQIKSYYSLGGWFYFHPFFYNSKYFTSMNDRIPDTAEKWRVPEYEENKWEVIFQFTQENQLKDICYFLKVSECKNQNKGGN